MTEEAPTATPIQLSSSEEACIAHVRNSLRFSMPTAIDLARRSSNHVSRNLPPEVQASQRDVAADAAVRATALGIQQNAEYADLLTGVTHPFSLMTTFEVRSACYGHDVRIQCESLRPNENLPRCEIQAPRYRTYRFP